MLTRDRYANSANHCIREMESGSLDGGDDGKHNGVCFVKLSDIFTTHDAFSFEIEQVDIVYLFFTQTVCDTNEE